MTAVHWWRSSLTPRNLLLRSCFVLRPLHCYTCCCVLSPQKPAALPQLEAPARLALKQRIVDLKASTEWMRKKQISIA